MTHELKILPEHFEAVAFGAKTAELRFDDRGYQVGDLLGLVEYDPSRKGSGFTGRRIAKRVTHVLRNTEQFTPLAYGYVMLSLGEV
jgi:hypothetical protein